MTTSRDRADARLREIERVRGEQRAAAAAAASRSGPVYVVQAAVMGDADGAATLLTDLIDSGHDGTLVASQIGESLLYEIRLGPFATLSDAERPAWPCGARTGWLRRC